VYGQAIPDSALQDLTYNASADMQAVHSELYPYAPNATSTEKEKADRKNRPGATGGFSTHGAVANANGDARHGHQLFFGTSETPRVRQQM
jgi:hypothetical protein